MDNATIIKLLDKQEQNIKEFIKATNCVTRAKLINNIEQVESKVDTIVTHNERQNGWIKKHSEQLELQAKAIISLEKSDISFENYQVHCPANKLATKISKRRFWIVAALVTTVVYLTLATIWHSVGFGDLILKLVDMI
jgi:hypothetical protein